MLAILKNGDASTLDIANRGAVESENTPRNVPRDKPLTRAILDGAQQIAAPAFVATLSITIVFVSVVFLEGAPRYLFTPMALAVGFSVMASYLLSRTVIPTMVRYLLPAEIERDPGYGPPRAPPRFGRVPDRLHPRVSPV